MDDTHDSTVCEDCGGTDDVVDGLCAECEHNYVWCDLCNQRRNEYSPCVHVFWNEQTALWDGPGYNGEDADHVSCRDGVWRMLDEQPIADLLAQTIRSGRIDWRGMSSRFAGYLSCASLYREDGTWHSHIMGYEPDEVADNGVEWLRCLGADTPDANTLTLCWISAWQDQQRLRAAGEIVALLPV